MKRVVPTRPKLLDEMKDKTGCNNKEMASAKACEKALRLYKIKGGKYKRIKTLKDLEA